MEPIESRLVLRLLMLSSSSSEGILDALTERLAGVEEEIITVGAVTDPNVLPKFMLSTPTSK